MKRPSFQFYPSDWLTAPEIRICSIQARGLWIDMICWMHQGEPYGHLSIGGKVILPPTLARLEGYPLDEVEGWLQELENVGVFSRREDGCIYSRRMVRDEELRQVRAAGGFKGGNPALLKKGKKTTKVNLTSNLTHNLPTEDGDVDEELSLEGECEGAGSPVVAEDIYTEYPRKVGKPVAIRSIEKALEGIDATELLKKTQQFAKARQGHEMKYTPHPSTWFNQERYNDDPETWAMDGNQDSTQSKEKLKDELNELRHEGRTALPERQKQIRPRIAEIEKELAS